MVCAQVARRGSRARGAFVVGVVPVLIGLAGTVGWFATGQDKLIPVSWLVGPTVELLVVLLPVATWTMMKSLAEQFDLNEAKQQDGYDGTEG
jgi:hypothetical protein